MWDEEVPCSRGLHSCCRLIRTVTSSHGKKSTKQRWLQYHWPLAHMGTLKDDLAYCRAALLGADPRAAELEESLVLLAAEERKAETDIDYLRLTNDALLREMREAYEVASASLKEVQEGLQVQRGEADSVTGSVARYESQNMSQRMECAVLKAKVEKLKTTLVDIKPPPEVHAAQVKAAQTKRELGARMDDIGSVRTSLESMASRLVSQASATEGEVRRLTAQCETLEDSVKQEALQEANTVVKGLTAQAKTHDKVAAGALVSIVTAQLLLFNLEKEGQLEGDLHVRVEAQEQVKLQTERALAVVKKVHNDEDESTICDLLAVISTNEEAQVTEAQDGLQVSKGLSTLHALISLDDH